LGGGGEKTKERAIEQSGAGEELRYQFENKGGENQKNKRLIRWGLGGTRGSHKRLTSIRGGKRGEEGGPGGGVNCGN